MAEQPAKRGAGRPRVRVLDRARITNAAIDLLRIGGLRALTVGALAQRLDVSPSAIYNHVSSRATILAWVQDQLVRDLDASGFGTLPWREATETWARSYYRMLRRHPEFVEITATVPIREAPDSARMYERVAYGLRAAGWSTRNVLPTISAIEAYVFGSTMDAAAPTDIYLTGANAKITPLLTAIVVASEQERATSGADPAELSFELGLAGLLDGLYAQHARPTVSDE